ncbi:MAG: hypothetical protein AAGA75_18660 [Cyanobacteria bacterium P01_E01_bin.6]
MTEVKTKKFLEEFRDWNGESQDGKQYLDVFLAWVAEWEPEEIRIKHGYMYPCEIIWDDKWKMITIAINAPTGSLNVFTDYGHIDPNFISIRNRKDVTSAVIQKVKDLFSLNV